MRFVSVLLILALASCVDGPGSGSVEKKKAPMVGQRGRVGAKKNGYALGSSVKKVESYDGKTVWLIAVALETGDFTKIASVEYKFPPNVPIGKTDGDPSSKGFPTGGRVVIDDGVKKFPVRAQVTRKDGKSFNVDAIVRLSSAAPASSSTL